MNFELDLFKYLAVSCFQTAYFSWIVVCVCGVYFYVSAYLCSRYVIRKPKEQKESEPSASKLNQNEETRKESEPSTSKSCQKDETMK